MRPRVRKHSCPGVFTRHVDERARGLFSLMKLVRNYGVEGICLPPLKAPFSRSSPAVVSAANERASRTLSPAIRSLPFVWLLVTPLRGEFYLPREMLIKSRRGIIYHRRARNNNDCAKVFRLMDDVEKNERGREEKKRDVRGKNRLSPNGFL